MKDGAGKGPGLKGPGSQDSGEESTGTATPGSGDVGETESPDNAGTGRPVPPFDTNVLIVTGIAGIFTLVGALLLQNRFRFYPRRPAPPMILVNGHV